MTTPDRLPSMTAEQRARVLRASEREERLGAWEIKLQRYLLNSKAIRWAREPIALFAEDIRGVLTESALRRAELAALISALDARTTERDALRQTYDELIMAVNNKYPGEG